MEENEMIDIQIKDEGLILINWEQAKIKDVFNLILNNKCSITYSSENAFKEFVFQMTIHVWNKVTVGEYMKAFTFACDEFSKQAELMNKCKMEE